MELFLHIPATFDAPDDWDRSQADRLRRTVNRALERSIRATRRPGVELRIVGPDRGTIRVAAPSGAGGGDGSPKERFEAVRLRQAHAGYDVPSYDDQGRPVALPVSDEETEQGVSIASTSSGGSVFDEPELDLSGDRFLRKKFPRRLVLKSRSRFAHAEADFSVIAENIVRAVAWGRRLFRHGFVILQPQGGPITGPFEVVGLSEPLARADLDSSDGTVHWEATGEIYSPRGYNTVAIGTSDEHLISSSNGRTVWNPVKVELAINRVKDLQGDRARIDPDDLETVGAYLLRGGRSSGGDEGQIALLVQMDRTLFGSMDWPTRAGYLELLTRKTGLDPLRRSAILEIIHATKTESELEAIFARLRDRGAYDLLFDHLDSDVYGLLTFLGSFRQAEVATWSDVRDLLIAMRLTTLDVLTDPISEIERAYGGAKSWVFSNIESIKMLLTEPEKIVEGIGALLGLLWTIELAKDGDPNARAFVGQMARAAASSAFQAISGLRYAEDLGKPYGAKAGGNKVTGDLFGKLRYFLLAELLSWFIGIGEIRAAMKAVTTAEKFAAIAKFLRSVRFIGKAIKIGEEAAKIERVLLALTRTVKATERGRLARIVELLPEAHLSALERMAKAVEIPDGADLEALRAALRLKGERELVAVLDQVADTMAVAAAVEARAGEAASKMAPGLGVLLRQSGLDREALIRLVNRVPAQNLGSFFHAMLFVRPDHLAKWGEKGLAELAEHPAALAFTRRAGGDAMDAVGERAGVWGQKALPNNLWDRARGGSSWDHADQILEGLEAARRGDPQAYQNLLVRIARGDRAAFEEAIEARHGRILSEAEKAGATAQYGLSRLQGTSRRYLRKQMEDIAAHNTDLLRARAEQLAKLPEKQLDGLEQLARLSDPSYDWALVLDHVSDADKADLLGPLAEVGPLCINPGVSDGGLDAVVHGILGRTVNKSARPVPGVQGSWGQLFAAQTLARKGATRLEFELGGSGALRRDADILAEIAGRRISVEVKTNIEGEASRTIEQIRRDLVNHAGTDYQDLLYMYHPSDQGTLPGIGRTMLRQFEEKAVKDQFLAKGLDIDKARAALRRWIDSGGLTTYSF
jgi:hypothetical protein